MTRDRRQSAAAFLPPAFVICTAVLALAGVGMSLWTQRLGLYLRKEPLPLRKSLDVLEETELSPYTVTAKIPIENPDILRSLGIFAVTV